MQNSASNLMMRFYERETFRQTSRYRFSMISLKWVKLMPACSYLIFFSKVLGISELTEICRGLNNTIIKLRITLITMV